MVLELKQWCVNLVAVVLRSVDAQIHNKWRFKKPLDVVTFLDYIGHIFLIHVIVYVRTNLRFLFFTWQTSTTFSCKRYLKTSVLAAQC